MLTPRGIVEMKKFFTATINITIKIKIKIRKRKNKFKSGKINY